MRAFVYNHSRGQFAYSYWLCAGVSPSASRGVAWVTRQIHTILSLVILTLAGYIVSRAALNNVRESYLTTHREITMGVRMIQAFQ